MILGEFWQKHKTVITTAVSFIVYTGKLEQILFN